MEHDPWSRIAFLTRRIGRDQAELSRLLNQVRDLRPATGGLRDLVRPVTCIFVGEIVGARSDKVAGKLRRRGLRVAKAGGTFYCEEEDAAKVFGKFKRYLKNREFD